MYQSSQSIQSRYNEKHLWPKGHSLFPQLLASLSYQPGDKTHLRLHHHGRKKTIIRFGALQEFAALTQALYRLVHSSSTDASCSFVSLSVRMRDLILGWYALDVYIYIYIWYSCWRNMFVWYRVFQASDVGDVGDAVWVNFKGWG